MGTGIRSVVLGAALTCSLSARLALLLPVDVVGHLRHSAPPPERVMWSLVRPGCWPSASVSGPQQRGGERLGGREGEREGKRERGYEI